MALLSKFHSGVNITRWFCYLGPTGDYSDHYQTYLKEEDFQNLKKLGVDYVRLCLSPEAIYDNGKPNSKTLPYVDAALKILTAHHLGVLLDLHDNGQMKLDEIGHENSGFVRFWEAVAQHYKNTYRSDVVFEILNEPIFLKNPGTWFELQAQTVKAIREIDPRRTILVTGTMWGGLDALLKLPLLPQKNLIYSFHCYDPFYFTHQGASWVGAQPGSFKNVPFPSSSEALDKVLKLNTPENQEALRSYGRDHFDAAYLKKRIALGASYGTLHKVPVLLGEFGAYPLYAPPESRARWFQAMRTAIDDAGIPYAIWGYDDSFGLQRVLEGSKVKLDPVTLKNFYWQ